MRFACPAVLAATVTVLLACAPSRSSRPPTHEELVNRHVQGKYAQVLAWCPLILDDRGAEPGVSDWCLFAYPAAMRLSLDTAGALGFVRAMCRDLAGQPKGDEAFREFYVAETARWFALPMRVQGQDLQLGRAVEAAVHDFGEACAVDPGRVLPMVDTKL